MDGAGAKEAPQSPGRHPHEFTISGVSQTRSTSFENAMLQKPE